jgi:hypothetical protein
MEMKEIAKFIRDLMQLHKALALAIVTIAGFMVEAISKGNIQLAMQLAPVMLGFIIVWILLKAISFIVEPIALVIDIWVGGFQSSREIAVQMAKAKAKMSKELDED